MSRNAHQSIVSAIRKLEREGVAVDGASIYSLGKNTFKVNFRGKQKGPGGETALYVGTKSDPRYIKWSGLIERRNKLKQYKRALKALQIADGAKDAAGLKKEKPSVEWYTPPEFVEMARSVLGRIDLDPASNPVAQEWVKAGKYFTKDDDGLKQNWEGLVWCNPPYGQWTKKFMAKALEHYRAGDVQECIFLVNRTGAAWYVDMTDQFSAVCQVRKRISFLTPSGKPEGSPRYYNDFVYLGPHPERFESVFSEIGRVFVKSGSNETQN